MRMLVFMLALPGCVIGEIVEGNGQSASEDRVVAEFSGVVATMAIPVDVVAGPAPAVRVTCDENLLEFIATDVDSGDLIVRSERDGDGFVAIQPTVDCRVEVTTPGANRLISTGSGLLTASGEELGGLSDVTSTGSGGLVVHGRAVAQRVSVTNTGSASVVVDGVEADTTELLSTGSGGMTVLDGATGALALTISGSGPVDAGGLVADVVNATISGSGSGQVTATESLSATITGSGGLVVFGDPEVRDVSETGSGSVTFE